MVAFVGCVVGVGGCEGLDVVPVCGAGCVVDYGGCGGVGVLVLIVAW